MCPMRSFPGKAVWPGFAAALFLSACALERGDTGLTRIGAAESRVSVTGAPDPIAYRMANNNPERYREVAVLQGGGYIEYTLAHEPNHIMASGDSLRPESVAARFPVDSVAHRRISAANAAQRVSTPSGPVDYVSYRDGEIVCIYFNGVFGQKGSDGVVGDRAITGERCARAADVQPAAFEAETLAMLARLNLR